MNASARVDRSRPSTSKTSPAPPPWLIRNTPSAADSSAMCAWPTAVLQSLMCTTANTFIFLHTSATDHVSMTDYLLDDCTVR